MHPETAESSAARALPGEDSSAFRILYVSATDPEVSFPGSPFVDELRAELQRLAVETAELRTLEEFERRAIEWSTNEALRYRTLSTQADSDDTRQVLVRRAVLGCAPLGLVSGAWLQWLSCPGNADDATVLRVLALYAVDIGVGHPRASRGSAYLALLRNLLLSENAVPPARLTQDRRIVDWCFHLPSLLLAMSRRPDDFMFEILGADLCLRTVGLASALVLVRERHPTAADWTAIDPGAARREEDPSGVQRSRAAVDALVDRGLDEGAVDRVTLGFAWTLVALRDWSSRLYADLDASRDPAYEMAELLRLRAREGSAYHQNFGFAGRPLSEWLADSCTDPSGLLDVLAKSKLVKPGRSDASALVGELVGERGPMFRVFAPEDLVVIRRWIDSLAADGQPPVPEIPDAQTRLYQAPPTQAPPIFLSPLGATAMGEDRMPASQREAYLLLQRRTDTPALRRYALDYVRGWLGRARYGIDEGATHLPVRWELAGLRRWLGEQHDRHGRDFQRTVEEPIPSKAALIDSTVQLAPLTLIDGSWLQGFTDYEHASSEVGHFLFETYWDELGNGESRLNHPLIYRQLLTEMGVEPPPTGSWEFVHWPGFRERSFELPVYWLSIGRFPQTYMPEVLGLNLAMELSGVGGAYRKSHIALKKYGFSSRFVDIHNTIDNVASGHSAWAAEAIDTYMAAIPVSPGAGAQTRTWERIRVGFRSLNPPGGWRARLAGRQARRAGRAQ